MDLTIDSVLQPNLELLNQQEEQLMQLLDKIRRAKEFFSDTPITERRKGSARVQESESPKAQDTEAPKAKSNEVARTQNSESPKSQPKKGRGKRTTTYLDDIMSLLKNNNSMKSRDIIQAISKKRGGDFKKMQYSIYPVFTDAVRNKKLSKSNGMYSAR